MSVFNKKKLVIFVYLLSYKLFLDLAYICFIHKYFEYMKFTLNFNQYKYVFSIFIFIIMYYILPKDKHRPSSIFLQLHFIIMIIPMFTIYAFMNESNFFLILSTSIFSAQCILLRLLPRFKIVRLRNSKFILYFLLIVITTFVYYSMIQANGVPSFQNLNFLKVYNMRDSVSYPFLMSYLVNWQGKVINPFFIVTAFLNNNKRNLFTSLFMQLFLYLITGHKTFLFIPFAILFIIKIISKNDFLKIASKTASLGTITLLIFYQITKSLVLPSTFLRRFLFIPAQNKFFYYDFFSQNEFMYFSAGVIGKMFDIKNPYNVNVVNMIGDIYYNSPNMNVNTGYIADAYANMGVTGMVLIMLLFVLILVLIDSISKKIGEEFTVGIALFSILSLNDGALLTTLLTGGMLFLMGLLYLYSNSSEQMINKYTSTKYNN